MLGDNQPSLPARLVADSTAKCNILDFQKSVGLPFQQRPGFVFIRLRHLRLHRLTVIVGVVTLVASILPLVALFQVVDFLNGVSGGVMRARGKQVRFCVSFILERD